MRPALKTIAPARSPERQALARAIAERTNAQSISNRLRVAAERARGALVAAQTRHSIADSALAEATERAIGAMTAPGGVQPPELRDLRQAVADAAADVDIARQALERAEAELAAHSDVDRKAVEALDLAVKAVVAGGFDQIYAAAKSAAVRMARLAYLAEGMGFAAPQDIGYGRYRKAQNLNPEMAVQGGEGFALREATRAEIAALKVALADDPDVPLPEVA